MSTRSRISIAVLLLAASCNFSGLAQAPAEQKETTSGGGRGVYMENSAPPDTRQKELIPEDTCILEFNLPQGATVNIDGRDYGTQRRLEFSQLEPGRIYASKMHVRFSDSKSREDDLLVRGGWSISFAPSLRPSGDIHLVPQTGHSSSVLCAVFDPTSRYLLTGDADGRVVTWDATNCRQVSSWVLGVGEIIAIAFRDDGSFVVVDRASGNAVVCRFEVGDTVRRFRVTEFATGPEFAAFTADGKSLLTCDHARTNHNQETKTTIWAPRKVVIWDTASGQRVRSFDLSVGQSVWVAGKAPDAQQERLGRLHCIDLSADGRLLATGSVSGDMRSGEITVWDTFSGECLRRWMTGAVLGVAFSPDAHTLLSGISGRGTLVWQTDTGAELAMYKDYKSPFRPERFASFTADGRFAMTGGGNQLSMWDVATGKPIWCNRLDERSSEEAPCTAISRDGRLVFASTRSLLFGRKPNEIALYDATTGKRLGSLPGGLTSGRATELSRVRSLALSPNNRYLLLGAKASAALWDFAGGEVTRAIKGRSFQGQLVGFNGDGSRMVVAAKEYGHPAGAVVVDTSTREEIRTIHSGTSTAVLTPSGDRLLTYHHRLRWTLHDLQTGSETARFEESERFHINCSGGYDPKAVFTSGGRTVVTGSPCDIGAVLWDCETGKPVRVFRRSEDVRACGGITPAVAVSPDERYVLTGDRDGAVVLWDLDNGNRIRDFVAASTHSNGTDRGRIIRSVAFSSDGRYVLAADSGGTVMVWGTADGSAVRVLKINEIVGDVGWTVDGRYVIVPCADDAVHVWDLATDIELARLITLDGGRQWLVATPDGLFDGSDAGRQAVAYRVGGSLNVASVDRFFKDFYRPGLLAAIWRGERPMPDVEIGKSLPPVMKIVSPQPGTTEGQEVTVEVEAADQGGGISGPWLMQNGARVLASGKSERVGNTLRRQFEVTLVEGENRLEVRAASADGSWESEPAVVVLNYAKPLVKPEVYLVAVGINRYAEETMNLKFAVADAKAMTELFQKRGPVLYGEGKVHVTQLLDGAATKQGIKKTLGEVAKKARAQDTLVLLLSGHGTMVGQRYYFLPHDFKHGSDDLEDAIRQRGLAGDELDEAVVAVPALKRVLIYDTCQSGGAIGPLRTARSPFAFQKAIEQMSRSQGSFVLAATSADEEAQESAQLEHGVLTYALLARLGAIDKGPLKDRPSPTGPVVKVRDWCGFAQDEVPDLTKVLFGKKQNVTFKASGNDFPILPSKTGQQGNMK